MAFNSRAKNRPNRTASKRVPLAEQRGVLSVTGKDDGYMYYWVNDTDSNIDQFQSLGYDFVTDNDISVGDKVVDSSQGTSSVKSKSVGGGIEAYLMRTKKEHYEEDQAFKQEQIDAREADMKRTLNNGKDGKYGKVDIK